LAKKDVEITPVMTYGGLRLGILNPVRCCRGLYARTYGDDLDIERSEFDAESFAEEVHCRLASIVDTWINFQRHSLQSNHGVCKPVYGCVNLPTMDPMLMIFPLAAIILGAKA